jgi:hypothetical protein
MGIRMAYSDQPRWAAPPMAGRPANPFHAFFQAQEA